ncbi:MAG: NAD-dependent epimerase/dehydratase family protein [Deltaproteobacteria bacterium]|nr:NAD-dependent epimerase/dehydratase family protein [Deltaproteobacteria bacterium]
MSILVSGASGFVGGALVRRLAGEGKEVHLVLRSGSSRQRLEGLSGICVHEADLRDADRVRAVVSEVRPRTIYHCAVYGGFASQSDTSAIFETNLTGTINLLQACERVGFELFVNAGSSSEYGIKNHPMREADPAHPIGDYGVAKCAATMFCRSEALLKGLPVVTLRLFSPYGPWDDQRRFIPYLIRCLTAGDSPCISTPDSVRDYIFIDDVLDLYRAVSEASVTPGEVYNAGSGRQHTIGEVAEIIRRITGGPELVWGGARPSRPEPKIWEADISKTSADFGWRPSIGFEEGIRRTFEWFHGTHSFP